MSFHRRVPVLLVSAAAVIGGVAGCGSSSSGPVSVAAPKPSSAQAGAMCRALHGKLPRTVDGERRRRTDPASAETGAWGDPAIVLRCGVRTPALLTPGSDTYNPQAESTGVNGVGWLIEHESGGAVRYTTVGREVNVQVLVPERGAKGSSAMVDPLLDFASAVKAAVPSHL